MCLGGGGGGGAPAAPPPAPPVAKPTTIERLSRSKARSKPDKKRRGTARKSLIIPRSGVQYSGSNSGVNV
jgi:hypothetical protein